MSHSRPPEPKLPDSLESPGAGFVAAAGVYVASVAVAVTVTVALAVDGSTATVVGSVSSVATAGLVVGAVLASRTDGLPERLGRRSRSFALPFVAPLGFAIASLAILVSSSVPREAVIGTGLGALGTTVAALGIVSMARTRYARAMAPEEPLATVPRLHPDHFRRSIGAGLACFAVGTALLLYGTNQFVGGEWLFGVASVPFAMGFAFALVGVSYRLQFAGKNGGDRSNSLLPDRQRRRVYGSDWSWTGTADPSVLPELRIHETGLVVTGSLGNRFVPWADVTAVELSPSELVVEHRGRFDCRCARAVIEDPRAVVERIERRRAAETIDERNPRDRSE